MNFSDCDIESQTKPSPAKASVESPIRIVRPVMKSARAESLENGTVFHYAGLFYVKCGQIGFELNGGKYITLSYINHPVTIYRVTELTEVFA